MHLLLGERRLTPAKVTDAIRPVSKRFQGPQANHAGSRSRIVGGPVHRPRLLFHHPETRLAQAARLIVIVGGEIRAPGAHVLARIARRGVGIVQVGAAQGVVVVAAEIQRRGQGEVVDTGV